MLKNTKNIFLALCLNNFHPGENFMANFIFIFKAQEAKSEHISKLPKFIRDIHLSLLVV